MKHGDYEQTTDGHRFEQERWEYDPEPARPCGAVALLIAFAALFGLAFGILIAMVS